MIPRLDKNPLPEASYATFLESVKSEGFKGDIRTDFGSRIVASTDNSIYQFVPQAVLSPRDHDDVVILMKTLGCADHSSIKISPRGGGTGTNAQSLTFGIVLDLSRHMNKIMEISFEEEWARVEPGVVLDQLNRALKPKGYMFGPTVSTSDRATLGGMIQTDAAGKGSRVYGKTSQHIIELMTVLPGGDFWTSRALSEEELIEIKSRKDSVGRIHRRVDEIFMREIDEIERVYPPLNRFMTGYNLKMIRSKDEGQFNLNYLLAGSEGTLGVVTEAKLKILKIPAHRSLVVLKYASFQDALSSAESLAQTEPTAIETMDETLLGLVKQDEAYIPVASVMEDEDGERVGAINLVEYSGEDKDDVNRRAYALQKSVTTPSPREAPSRVYLNRAYPIGAHIVQSEAQAQAFWTLRKRSVGLLGNLPGKRKPVAFVEDTVVPPERLSSFVRDFRALLDDAGLTYGIFGHVDVGCMHVRPALDLKQAEDFQLLQRISDSVATLVKSYGGIIWGEHGKGVRGQYNPLFFGERIYKAMREIKGEFDSQNQLNPGKIAVPLESSDSLLGIDSPTRGEREREIAPSFLDRFDDVIRCNGNGQCHSDQSDYVMCPSWKETRDRIHTPKGRASLVREWITRLSRAGFNPAECRPASFPRRIYHDLQRRFGLDDFSHEVLHSMQGCLVCKACAGQCPVKVDVPDFRAEFLQSYYDRYPRPLRDHFVAGLERLLPWMSRAPWLFNAPMKTPGIRSVMEFITGMVDIPQIATPTLAQSLRGLYGTFDIDQLSERSVVLVQDAFFTFYQPHVVVAALSLIRKLGYSVHLLPYFVNGKSLHVKGFTRRFQKVAQANATTLKAIASKGATLVGLDPAVTLTYRDEYRRVLGPNTDFTVRLLPEWLDEATGEMSPTSENRESYRLLLHCTEKALLPKSTPLWIEVFNRFDLSLDVKSVGCCGMCGAYGHEKEKLRSSRGIYDRSWREAVEDSEIPSLVTGYSCHSQVLRFSERHLEHPVEILERALSSSPRLEGDVVKA